MTGSSDSSGGWGGPAGPWGRGWGTGPGGGPRSGPPPWVAGLLGLGQGGGPGRGEPGRGPRARRGDVRSAILDVLRVAGQSGPTGEPINGYQVIQQIIERSGEAWRPSPGSVYPTIQQLEDEGLVAADDDRGRRTLSLTPAGTAYVAEHADELAAVWVPFARHEKEQRTDPGSLKPEIGQVMSAVWQIVSTGSEQQRRAAVGVLVEARRNLYGILADGQDPEGVGDPDEVTAS